MNELNQPMGKAHIYTMMFSTVFPKNHPSAGQPTNFPTLIQQGLKIHSIRSNYELWRDRAICAADGNCILSLRIWEDKPYRSKQVVLKNLHTFQVQKLRFHEGDICMPYIQQNETKPGCIPMIYPLSIKTLANNDGLSLKDWINWFETYDLTKPFALVSFTNHLYEAFN